MSPLVARTKADLKEFAVSGLFGTAFGYYLIIMNDSSYLTFPSFHIIWTVISLFTISSLFPKAKLIWLLIGILVVLSCIITGQETMPDVLAGLIVTLFVKKRQFIYSVKIPIYKKNIFKAYKISKRFDDDISSVCASFNVEIYKNQIKKIINFWTNIN